MPVYKTANEAYESLKANLENKLGDSIQTGSVIDIYNKRMESKLYIRKR